MADFAKLSVAFAFSEQSDYSDPEYESNLDPYEVEVEGYTVRKLEITTSAETIQLDEFSSIAQLIIKNDDKTNYVTATHDSAGNGATDNIHRVGAGKFLVLSDVTPGSDLVLQANGAACKVKVIIIGETP